MKIPIRAAQNKQRGRMRPAGPQFDTPALEHYFWQHWCSAATADRDVHLFLNRDRTLDKEGGRKSCTK